MTMHFLVPSIYAFHLRRGIIFRLLLISVPSGVSCFYFHNWKHDTILLILSASAGSKLISFLWYARKPSYYLVDQRGLFIVNKEGDRYVPGFGMVSNTIARFESDPIAAVYNTSWRGLPAIRIETKQSSLYVLPVCRDDAVAMEEALKAHIAVHPPI